jgi:hypothetical protein
MRKRTRMGKIAMKKKNSLIELVNFKCINFS